MPKVFVRFFATGAYTGYFPFAPGTAGTLPGLLAAYLISGLSFHIQAIVIIGIILISIYTAGAFADELGQKDPSKIVCDEVSGVMAASFMVPQTLINIILVFLLFRFFDILKPYPVSFFDKKVPGGTGIVLDDVCAGVYANIAVHLVMWYII